MMKFIFALFLACVSLPSHSGNMGNYIDLLNYELSTKYWIDKFILTRSADTDLLVNHILFNAAVQDVPLDLLIGTIAVESRFNPKATSKHGAKGIMQVVTRYHRDKIRNRNIFDPKVGLEVGTQILADCYVKYHGNRHRALNCYNGNGQSRPTDYSRAVLAQSSRFREFLNSQST